MHIMHAYIHKFAQRKIQIGHATADYKVSASDTSTYIHLYRNGIHTYTYTHIHIHRYTRAYIHNIHDVFIHTCIPTHTYTQHTRTYIQAMKRLIMKSRPHGTSSYIHLYRYYIHTYIYTHIHIHGYDNTNIHIGDETVDYEVSASDIDTSTYTHLYRYSTHTYIYTHIYIHTHTYTHTYTYMDMMARTYI